MDWAVENYVDSGRTEGCRGWIHLQGAIKKHIE